MCKRFAISAIVQIIFAIGVCGQGINPKSIGDTLNIDQNFQVINTEGPQVNISGLKEPLVILDVPSNSLKSSLTN